MQYVSTRGQAPVLSFDQALLTGLATDGGLYVPDDWPQIPPASLAALSGRSYAEIAMAVVAPFIGDTIARPVLQQMVDDTYAGFDHAAVAPLQQVDHRLWLMELFHGPTLAFKDYALQLVGRLFDHVLAAREQRATIIGATSGDTGSAAIEACRGRSNVDIFILHPHNRVSPVQRRQMTTVTAPNVHNIAVEGSFDDCQALVKAMFADAALREHLKLTAVNSINWARIMAQIVYYVTAAVALGAPARPVSFAVPTGNFGNVFAAYAARAMGVPIRRLAVGANANDVLHRFFATGRMAQVAAVPTLSPAMDIQVSSNFERLLFDLEGRDGAATARQMAAFGATGTFEVSATQLATARGLFTSARCDDDQTIAVMQAVAASTGVTVDPHTAVGIAAARDLLQRPEEDATDAGEPVVALACAHPAKFPDAVARALGAPPAAPERLAAMMAQDERFTVLGADYDAVSGYVRAHASISGNHGGAADQTASGAAASATPIVTPGAAPSTTPGAAPGVAPGAERVSA